MMNDPIVVWPPGTFAGCAQFGAEWTDCSNEYYYMIQAGAEAVCCSYA